MRKMMTQLGDWGVMKPGRLIWFWAIKNIRKELSDVGVERSLQKDVLALYRTGVFNNTTLGYAEKAMRLQHLSRGRIDDVRDAMRLLHDAMGAEIAAY